MTDTKISARALVDAVAESDPQGEQLIRKVVIAKWGSAAWDALQNGGADSDESDSGAEKQPEMMLSEAPICMDLNRIRETGKCTLEEFGRVRRMSLEYQKAFVATRDPLPAGSMHAIDHDRANRVADQVFGKRS